MFMMPGRPGGGFREVVLSPEAAALCQAGRVASDGVPRLSAQVVEQQHRLVCFCAKSSPTPTQTTAVCDQLSPFPLFLCRSTCLPSNPVCLDSARLQPPRRSSEADWFVGYASNVCYSSPILPPQVQHKGPKVGGSGRDLSGQAGLPSPPLPVLSYEGVLASYLPMTTEPFSCLGEEHPGVGPRYGEELLLVEVGLQGRDKERAHPARLLMKPHTSSTLHLLMSSTGFAVAESSPSMKRPPTEPEEQQVFGTHSLAASLSPPSVSLSLGLLLDLALTLSSLSSHISVSLSESFISSSCPSLSPSLPLSSLPPA
ncbi:hypothetical protein F7725_000576 [Dissostichus mawsoni]|uniref:Uncharacterized protein n=1 Tax=Dissostichus mawsoni TaxID=36200 RepID=A0A7J5ZGR7_DISMA|nr:hypothetical protein F7725_000576 [Dissostichus mawsoni]